nr:hypothetical protein [Tanacetum cinerariifolium]
ESEGESEEDEETRQKEEESFDPIPRTPDESEEESNDEEDQELRIVRKQEYKKKETLMNCIVTSISTKEGAYNDVGVESIFTTASSPIVSFQTPTPIMTPSTIATIATSSEAPIPPSIIPSIILENLPTFNSAFRFEERLRQPNPFADAVSVIPESVNATLEAEVLTRSSHSSRTSYAIARSDEQRNLYKALVEAYEADKAILDTYGDSTILKRRREDDDQEGPSAGSNRGSKRQKEIGDQASASTLSEKATEGTGGSTTGSQSRQMSASESAFAEEPVQTTCQMEEPPHPVFETGADDQPIVQTSQHPEWFSQPRRPPSLDRAWNTNLSAAQGDAQS